MTNNNNGRLKELACINKISSLLREGKAVKETLYNFTGILTEGFADPEQSYVRLSFGGKVYLSRNFIETPVKMEETFETINQETGRIEVFFSDKQHVAGDQGFASAELELIQSVNNLLHAYLNAQIARDEKFASNERLKELAAINNTTRIIKEGRSMPDTLRHIVSILPQAWQYPDATCARIVYDDAVFTSNRFCETQWAQEEAFETIENKKGLIQVFYREEFPEMHEGPFLKEERDLISNLSGIISGYLNSLVATKDKYISRERLKELAAINQTTRILKEKKPIEETLTQICNVLPSAWQYPEVCCARITYAENEYTSDTFQTSPWVQIQEFDTIDDEHGSIEIFYLKRQPEADEGPFLKEERHLLINLSGMVSGFLNSVRGKFALKQTLTGSRRETKTSIINSRQLLQRFLNKNNYNRDIFHDLMPFKVREILLVANLYDAYSIEKEGRFSEHILGEYYQLNLSSVPRITGVSSFEEAMEQLDSRHFDMVILMGGNVEGQMVVSNNIRHDYPYIPIYLLLNNNMDALRIEQQQIKMESIDNVFTWNGDPNIFFAIIKQLEDQVNVENDTSVGLVRIILLVEDSAKYYSRYLPLLYSAVMEQTKRLIEDVNTDELFKVLKLRARPKILMASNYEEAMEVFTKYKDYMLCLISDVKFRRKGILDGRAGFELVKEVRGQLKDLPIILQSSDPENSHEAFLLKSSFINKNSDKLVQDIRYFISTYLGFGSFVYKDSRGRPIATARTLREFEKLLRTIPDDSLGYHARRNHFSLWFMARGEIQIARIIYPFRLEDFTSADEIRKFLLNAIQLHRNEQNKGKIINFEESLILDETNIVSLAGGSFGGKGRGVAFINTLIYNIDFQQFLPEINIKAPKTFIIGTDEFESFLLNNKLHQYINDPEVSYEEIRKHFIEAELSGRLVSKLKKILRILNKPLAIRSSGLFEDSQMQPFAGIFETYLIPNKHEDLRKRLDQIKNAIKLVYASVFSPTARDYISAVNYKIEEEKMAVIIQEVVGHQFDNVYYPHISGVAQSYNYYPFAHMKPEEGFAVAAVGLGTYVVEGEKAYRFSPKYPTLEINSPQDQFKTSQVEFFAIDLNKKDLNLIDGEDAALKRMDIYDAEVHGTIKHCASVYNADNNAITPGTHKQGPRIINFADILKYNYIPLARTIEVVLDVVKEAMGSPVEIEFAVDLKRDKDYRASFYLLQIKPLIGNATDYNIDPELLDEDKLLLFTDKGMGNGLIDELTDVIYVDRKTFNKSATEEIAREVDALNKKMIGEGRKYLLIGPGRWGTRDKFIGIPVNWTQISNARVIVETSLTDFPLDASSGSHFFHNVTSMNVGYLSVNQELEGNFIKWDMFENQELIQQTKYCRHVRFDKNFAVRMDGKKRISVICLGGDEESE